MRAWPVVASLIAIGAASYALSAGPAAADWGYARWNMTPEEVQKAATDDVQPLGEIDQRIRSEGTLHALLSTVHEDNGFKSLVDFLFDPDNHLQRVIVNLDDAGQCPRLISRARDRYGKTNIDSSEGAKTTLEWQDKENSNVILLVSIPGLSICQITYSYTLSYKKFAN